MHRNAPTHGEGTFERNTKEMARKLSREENQSSEGKTNETHHNSTTGPANLGVTTPTPRMEPELRLIAEETWARGCPRGKTREGDT